MTERKVCECYKPKGKMCSPCFQIWYDSGIQNAEHLYAEKVAREENGYWPFGVAMMPLAEIETINKQYT